MRSRSALAAEFEAAFGDRHVVELHAAPRRIGGVIGGIDAVVDALIDALGADRTVLVPTFTAQLTDPSGWSHPPAPRDQWDQIRAELPLFDPGRTTPRHMGRIADLLFRRPGTLRSAHPAESIASHGPLAAWLVAPHPIDDPMGPRSPWARLVERDARVVLLGVELDNCSLLHHVEQLAEVPYLEQATYAVPIAVPGMHDDSPSSRGWVDVVAGGACSQGFPLIQARLFQQGVLSRTTIGEAPTLVCNARPLFDATLEILRRDPYALLCQDGTCSACDAARA